MPLFVSSALIDLLFTEAQWQPYTDRFIGSNDDNSSFHSRSISSISSSDLGNLNGYHKQLLDSSQSHALHDKSPERLRSRSEGQIGAPHISAWPTQLPFHPNQTSTLKKKLKCKNYIDEKESGEKAIKLEQASTEEPPKFLAIFELPKHKLDATAPIIPIKLKDPGQEGVRSGNTGGRYRRIAPANRKCDYCGAQFTRKDRLKYHIESSHLRLEPGFKCEKLGCGRAFRQKSDLVRHLRHVHQQRDT
ncbi:hypothetical protein BY996DRAFT_8469126 [Phakopsora pachyrhizi]|nr:hypothetical protein BY996DRAFT_8469126 [Phakopsora pachyrhizi]